MLLIYDDEKVWASMPEKERNGIFSERFAFTNELRERDAYVDGDTEVSAA